MTKNKKPTKTQVGGNNLSHTVGFFINSFLSNLKYEYVSTRELSVDLEKKEYISGYTSSNCDLNGISVP